MQPRTANGDVANRINLLEEGVDDYIVKPCSVRKVIARSRAGADGYLVKGGQVEPTLPPIRVFRHPAQGILQEFLHRHAMAA